MVLEEINNSAVSNQKKKKKAVCTQSEGEREKREEEVMAMRDLVTGGAACAVPGASTSSNPLGALANTLLGSSSKTQVLFLEKFDLIEPF